VPIDAAALRLRFSMTRSFSLLAFLVSVIGVAPLRAELPWITSMADAKVMASKADRRLILEFTGSDWCYACKKLEAEVFSSAEFEYYAGSCILVRLDYPNKKKLPLDEVKQNSALKDEYKVEAFPTVVITDAFGHEVSRAVGYKPGSGPKAYLTVLTGETPPAVHY